MRIGLPAFFSRRSASTPAAPKIPVRIRVWNALRSSTASYFFFSYAIVLIIIILVILLIKDKYDAFVSDNIIVAALFLLAIFGFFLGCLLRAISRWFGTPIGPHLFEMQIYERANRLKKEANLVLAVIFVLVIGSAIVFFKASTFARDDADELFGADTLKAASALSPLGAAQANSGPAATLPMLPALIWARIIMVTAVRVGDIAVASFLTFMLVRIYRYNLRLSAFYYSRADAIVLSNDKRYRLVKREALPVLFDANFDFGKDHPSLVADFARLMGALYPPAQKKGETPKAEEAGAPTKKGQQGVTREGNRGI